MSRQQSDIAARAVAELLVRGDGVPRTPGQIVEELTKALIRAHAEGKAAAWPAARLAALSEVKHALAGAVAGIAATDRTVQIEIDQLHGQVTS